MKPELKFGLYIFLVIVAISYGGCFIENYMNRPPCPEAIPVYGYNPETRQTGPFWVVPGAPDKNQP